jgi:hypothetical protein
MASKFFAHGSRNLHRARRRLALNVQWTRERQSREMPEIVTEKGAGETGEERLV